MSMTTIDHANVKDNMELIHLLNDIRMTTDAHDDVGSDAGAISNSVGSQQIFYDEDGLPMDDFLYALKHHQISKEGLHVHAEHVSSGSVNDILPPGDDTKGTSTHCLSAHGKREHVLGMDHSCMTINSQSSSEPGGSMNEHCNNDDDDDSVSTSISDFIDRNMTTNDEKRADADSVPVIDTKPHIRMQPPARRPKNSLNEEESTKRKAAVKSGVGSKPTTKKQPDSVLAPGPAKATNAANKSAAAKKATKRRATQSQQQQQQQELAHRMSTEQLQQRHSNDDAGNGDEQSISLLARNKSLTMRLKGQLQTIRELEYRCATLKSQDDEKGTLIKALYKKINVLVTQIQATQSQEGAVGGTASTAGVSVSSVTALKSQLQHAQQKLTEQTTIATQLKDAHGTLLTKHNESVRQHKFQEERYRLLKQYAEKMKTRTQELDMCLQTQENTLQSIQKTNKSLKLSSKEHSSDSAALREVLQERDVEIQQWKYRAEKLQDSLSHTQAQLKQSKAEKRELRMDLAAAADRTVQYNELMERSREERVRQKLQQRMDNISSNSNANSRVDGHTHTHGRGASSSSHGGYDQPTASWVRHTEPDGTHRSFDVSSSVDSEGSNHVKLTSRSASPVIDASAHVRTRQVPAEHTDMVASHHHIPDVNRAPFYARGAGHRSHSPSCGVSAERPVDCSLPETTIESEPEPEPEPESESVNVNVNIDCTSSQAGIAVAKENTELPNRQTDAVSNLARTTIGSVDANSGSSANSATILNSVDVGKRERYNRLKHMYDRIVSGGK